MENDQKVAVTESFADPSNDIADEKDGMRNRHTTTSGMSMNHWRLTDKGCHNIAKLIDAVLQKQQTHYNIL